MAWLISIITIIGYFITGDSTILLASGLFSIAGAIEFKDIWSGFTGLTVKTTVDKNKNE